MFSIDKSMNSNFLGSMSGHYKVGYLEIHGQQAESHTSNPQCWPVREDFLSEVGEGCVSKHWVGVVVPAQDSVGDIVCQLPWISQCLNEVRWILQHSVIRHELGGWKGEQGSLGCNDNKNIIILHWGQSKRHGVSLRGEVTQRCLHYLAS